MRQHGLWQEPTVELHVVAVSVAIVRLVLSSLISMLFLLHVLLPAAPSSGSEHQGSASTGATAVADVTLVQQLRRSE